jgi:hypothetical protein
MSSDSLEYMKSDEVGRGLQGENNKGSINPTPPRNAGVLYVGKEHQHLTYKNTPSFLFPPLP